MKLLKKLKIAGLFSSVLLPLSFVVSCQEKENLPGIIIQNNQNYSLIIRDKKDLIDGYKIFFPALSRASVKNNKRPFPNLKYSVHNHLTRAFFIPKEELKPGFSITIPEFSGTNNEKIVGKFTLKINEIEDTKLNGYDKLSNNFSVTNETFDGSDPISETYSKEDLSWNSTRIGFKSIKKWTDNWIKNTDPTTETSDSDTKKRELEHLLVFHNKQYNFSALYPLYTKEDIGKTEEKNILTWKPTVSIMIKSLVNSYNYINNIATIRSIYNSLNLTHLPNFIFSKNTQ